MRPLFFLISNPGSIWAPFRTPFGARKVVPFGDRFWLKTQGKQREMRLLGDPKGVVFGVQNGALFGSKC